MADLAGLKIRTSVISLIPLENGRGERIRTSDPLLPKQVRYQAALQPDRKTGDYTAWRAFASGIWAVSRRGSVGKRQELGWPYPPCIGGVGPCLSTTPFAFSGQRGRKT